MSRHLPDWLEAYLLYTVESESPTEFHTWVGTSVIAGALEREVYYDMGYFLVYPNMYAVLVSPPGRCKKSTAMRIGRRILAGTGKPKFSTDSTSRERLILDLSQSHQDGQSAMTAFSSEFATLLTTSGMDMVVFLTDIYDCPNEWEHKTKGGGTNKIKSPYLNLIAGTTPDWIARAMPLDTIGVGLTSRIVFIYQDTPRIKHPRPKLTPEQKQLEILLIEDLAVITQIAGEYVMTTEAEEWYDKWYIERDDPMMNDPRMAGYYERKPMHLIKLSMVVAASQWDELIIDLKHLQRALNMLERNEELMSKVFANVGRNPLNADLESILVTLLIRPSGVSKSELLNRFRHNVRAAELDEILETLINMRKVVLQNGMYKMASAE